MAHSEMTLKGDMPIRTAVRYAVVYQFGKVASTSVVATLDAIDGVTAVQSHFLGEHALARVVPTITAAEVPQYFFAHQLGQFIHNMRVTRRLNMIRSGKTGERLLIISMSRNPIQWARSSVVQDAKGYLPILRAYARRNEVDAPEADGPMIEAALGHLIGAAADLMEAQGGIDLAIAALQANGRAVLDTTPLGRDPGSERLLRMILRPYDWFDVHFQRTLGLGPADMRPAPFGLEESDAHADYAILRYEDLAEAVAACCRRFGVADDVELKRENLSESKLFAEEIARAFRSEPAERLSSLAQRTKYARWFGYDGARTA